MERHSCSMPCLTKAWTRTLPKVASDSEAIAVEGPTRKARQIKPSVSVVFIHSDHFAGHPFRREPGLLEGPTADSMKKAVGHVVLPTSDCAPRSF